MAIKPNPGSIDAQNVIDIVSFGSVVIR